MQAKNFRSHLKTTFLLFCVWVFHCPFLHAQIITTYAGSGPTGAFAAGFGGDGGAATSALINGPFGVTMDSLGNMYINDTHNFRIRKVGVDGIITTIAGNGSVLYTGEGGPATGTGITPVDGIAIDNTGNVFYIDYNCIRKIDVSGIITTYAGTGTAGYTGDGGPATAAEIGPSDIAIDKYNNIYIATFGSVIRKINTAGVITTVAGNGTSGYMGDGIPATAAELIAPTGVAVDRIGNIYINDVTHIRKVDAEGIIHTIAGDRHRLCGRLRPIIWSGI